MCEHAAWFDAAARRSVQGERRKTPRIPGASSGFGIGTILYGTGRSAVRTVWMVEDEANQVLRLRRTFRERVRTLATPASDVAGAEMIYGELVGNAVRHAAGRVEVRLEVHDGDAPVLTVRDHGPGLRCHPWTPRRDPYAESGRGLGIVEMLARDVAVRRPRDGGTVVRAVLPVTPRAEFA